MAIPPYMQVSVEKFYEDKNEKDNLNKLQRSNHKVQEAQGPETPQILKPSSRLTYEELTGKRVSCELPTTLPDVNTAKVERISYEQLTGRKS